ncbi:ImmA/IrrE family metallo-endopeptidase [Rhizobium sp. BK176]|uniref:ImmA/IrrE family metallo-endopeptidase n=1 Tax=Rhizobium sp. BK176 TaxID=2587071 RepID=UPI002166F407|nr:ImmA/IrrE family metallo-endopeptidase [Rhizobium sp. BK176]MCS4088494.1 Zn-dependent peptidase ImmA (M78 family) [Rhizobium sp. BK176]
MNIARKTIVSWKARRVLAKLEIVKPPVDAEAVARTLGFNVVYATLEGSDMANILGFSDPADNTIYVTGCSSFPERQMTIAAELGKALLHPKWWRSEKAYRLRTTRGALYPQEFEAEWFALNLLVPHRWIDELQRYAAMHELETVFATDCRHIAGALARRLPR